MDLSQLFFINSLLLGVGLAMDAFSISVVNGMNEPDMVPAKMVKISAVFGFFQALMPVLGWVVAHTLISYFSFFASLMPWISFILLLFIGGRMVYLSRKPDNKSSQNAILSDRLLILQGVATSLDAFSAGIVMAEHGAARALLCALIIASVTFVICLFGVRLGRKAGLYLAEKAECFGGCVLIAIGVEIFLTGVL